MIRLDMKNYNMILTDKQKKFQHYYQIKLININVSHMNKYYLLIKKESINELNYSTFGNALENKEKRLKFKAKSK